jgi:hypothetical protein
LCLCVRFSFFMKPSTLPNSPNANLKNCNRLNYSAICKKELSQIVCV